MARGTTAPAHCAREASGGAGVNPDVVWRPRRPRGLGGTCRTERATLRTHLPPPPHGPERGPAQSRAPQAPAPLCLPRSRGTAAADRAAAKARAPRPGLPFRPSLRRRRRRAAQDARLGQPGPGTGLSCAPVGVPVAQVLRRPGRRLAAFPGRPALEPWGPPSPRLPRCPGAGSADLGCWGNPPHAPWPASEAQDPGTGPEKPLWPLGGTLPPQLSPAAPRSPRGGRGPPQAWRDQDAVPSPSPRPQPTPPPSRTSSVTADSWMPAEPGPEAGSGWPGLLMSCLKGPHVILKMEAMKIVHPEKFPELQAAAPCFPPAPRPTPALAPKRAWPSDTEIIVNQACGGDMPVLEGAPHTPPLPRRPRKGSAELGFPRVVPADEVIVNQYVMRPGPPAPAPSAAGEPLECPTCGHTYNATQRRPRVLSCLHSVCEQCLQILYESCPKYKFISCPTCHRETVLFTDYGLAALAINTSILSRLPPEALTAPPSGQWGGEPEGSCYQTFRQYCGAACTCHVRNPLSACSIM